MKIYYCSGTRAVRVVWLFQELGLDYDLVKLEFHPRVLKSDAHRAIHPLGRVPVLQDGDMTMFESGAIVQYVLDRYAGGRLRPAIDSPDYAHYLQWFHYCEGTLMPPINTIVVQTLLLAPERRDPAVLATAQKLAGKVLLPINDALADNEHLCGEFSAADIMLGHGVAVAERLELVTEQMPQLQSYIERLNARPAFQTATGA